MATEAELLDLRQGARARAQRVSAELRKSATKVRSLPRARTAQTTTPYFVSVSGSALAAPRRTRWTIGLLFLAFATVFVGYPAYFQSAQYTTEARFAVRTGERATADPIAALSALSNFTQAQDSLIIVNYLKSRAMVDALEQKIDLRALFSRRDIDWYSRFDRDDEVERLVRYWRNQVKASVESQSGIISVQFSAFSPADAKLIADTVVSISEELINTMSARARRDTLREAETEVARAEGRLSASRIALERLRNLDATLDPRKAADALGKLIGELRLDRAKLEQDAVSAQRNLVGANAPQIQMLRTRMQVIDEQIASLQARITASTSQSAASDGGKALGASITRFDQIELERKVAEKQYTEALTALERARMNAGRQTMYLATFVQPILPQEHSWPYRIWFSLIGLGLAVGATVGARALFGLVVRRRL